MVLEIFAIAEIHGKYLYVFIFFLICWFLSLSQVVLRISKPSTTSTLGKSGTVTMGLSGKQGKAKVI